MRYAKYNEEIKNKICSLIEADSYTVREICKAIDIHIATYYDWLNNKPEFTEAVKKARGQFYEHIQVECEKSLVKLIKGYNYKEKTSIIKTNKNGEAYVAEAREVEKHIPPSVPAVIFSLTNRDSENWKNRQNTEITGKDGKDLLPYQDMSREEIMQEIERIRAKMDGKG